MVLVPRTLSHIFQHRAYPRINPNNHVMEWWVESALFDTRSRVFLDSLNAVQDSPTPSDGEPVFDDSEESEDDGNIGDRNLEGNQ